MVTPTLTQRQDKLITELRNNTQQVAYLINRNKAIRAELERIYPEAKQLSPPPPAPGTVISVWNYATLNYEAQVTITHKGRVALEELPAYLKDVQVTVLALLLPRPQGADLTKLFALPFVKDEPNYKRRVKDLHIGGYIDIEFTKEGINNA